MDMHKILFSLARKRPVFHSEADYQHALAWEIQQRLPEATIRLEMPFQIPEQLLYIDIWVAYQDKFIAVELKYKTRNLSVRIDDEQYRLKNQGAQDIGRYDFLKDIQRLEQASKQYKEIMGYAVLLTNDSTYWTISNRKTVDAEFRLHNRRIIAGTLAWGDKASDGTKRKREQPIELEGTYQLHWEDYSRPSDDRHGRFRSLVVKV